MIYPEKIKEAHQIVVGYTLAAIPTGAIPVPAASGAIVAENAAMIAHIASALGTKISVSTVISCLSTAATVNMVGRTLFLEGAKLLSWGTASAWAMPLLCAFGASTAGIQTYIIGRLAIEIAKNGGAAISEQASDEVVKAAKKEYEVIVASKKAVRNLGAA